MPQYLTFMVAKIKIKLPSHFFPNSHGCVCLLLCLSALLSGNFHEIGIVYFETYHPNLPRLASAAFGWPGADGQVESSLE